MNSDLSFRPIPLSILYQIGSKAFENEDASEAKAIFTRIVEKDPRAASGHIGLAEAYDLLGTSESAISHYQHALKNDPKNKKAREKLAAFGVDLSAYPENVAIPLDVLKTYVGRYINPGLDPHDIAMEGDELVLKAGGQDIALYAVAKDRFRSDAFGLSVSFEADETGSIMSMTVEASGWSRRFERN